MNFNIEQIVIMVDSNIPGKEPFELTNKTFHHPDLKSAQMHAFSKHPYFIIERKYPRDKLYILARMSYNKILRFFFDKKYFETKLIGFYKQEDAREKKEKANDEEETDEQKKDKRKKFDEIASHNVKIMIELLFPTSWPAVRNISDSHSEYILGKKEQGISFKDTVNQKVNFGFVTKGTNLTSGLFSYLKVDSKIYTISRVVWLDDLLNHPVYRKFIDNFINYSLWIDRERDRMEILLATKNKKLFGRILDENSIDAKGKKKTRIDSLNIFGEENNFIENRKKESVDLDPNKRDFKKIQFYEDLDKLISQMTNFKHEIEKENNSTSNINKLFSLSKDLMDSYNRLKQNDRVKLKGITDNFHIKLSKIVEEFKKLNVLEKIKTNYMSKGEINTKLEGEDPDVVAELKKDYSRLIEFIDKSKDLLEPKRESSNYELQEIIVDYSENSKKTDPDNTNNDVLVFKELMDKVRTEMVFLRKDKKTSDKDKALMYVGVCGVDKNKMGKPHFEVYLAIDVIEGEINANNLEGVKCKYRGLYLGRETENFFTKYNKFEVKQHRVYVPEKDEDERLPDEKDEVEDNDMVKHKENNEVVPEEKRKVNGGKRSRKRHLNKTQSKRWSRSRRSILLRIS